MSARPGPTTAVQRKQIPGWMRRIDDPWGITWRAINMVRRFSPARTMRFHAARFRDIRHERPVFVLGAPRSGTSTLFHLLSHHGQLGSLWKEGHDLWRKYHHPRQTGWTSDRVGAGMIRPGERMYIKQYLYSHFDQPRFVEKTPENCLRIPYLLELFPDAYFIVIRRDPRATISSLINGWRHPEGRFRSYFVPETLAIPGYTRPRQWCFTLIDGWREFKTRPIPEIAAEQWRQSAVGLIAGRKLVGEARWREISLEDYSSDARGTIDPLLEWLELPQDASMNHFMEQGTAVNVMEGGGDWRKNEKEVMAVLPALRTEIIESGFDPAALGLGA